MVIGNCQLLKSEMKPIQCPRAPTQDRGSLNSDALHAESTDTWYMLLLISG